jgi:hypothetical protein
LDSHDSRQVESFQPVGRKVVADELGELHQAVFDVIYRVATHLMHCLIIPDFKIEFLKSILHLAIIEESFLAILVLVFLVNIDGKNNWAGCYLRWLEFEESGVIQLELGDLESHVYDSFVLVVV